MKLTRHIDRIEGYDISRFRQEYMEPLKPVVFTDFMKGWKAGELWNIGFFKEKYGHVPVPVYNEDYHKPGKNYMSSVMEIPFREYLESIENGPSSLRLFLFNILKNIPELESHIPVPEILQRVKTGPPFLFFGGEGAKVGLHYDIDMAHVFLSQFHGTKRVILFAPDQSTALYKQPFTVHSYLDPDDESKNAKLYPAVKEASGFEILLHPGETLFIPSGYWHFIVYQNCSFSISMRAYSSFGQLSKGIFNLATHFLVNKSLNTLFKDKWRDYKMSIARKKAEALLNNSKSQTGMPA